MHNILNISEFKCDLLDDNCKNEVVWVGKRALDVHPE